MNKTPPKKITSNAGQTLEQKAQALFVAERYKEAAVIFKDALKQADNPIFRQQLAQCYLQRALGMAVKGMYKEACVLWENYAEWTESPNLALDSYILWLILAKSTQKAYARLTQITAQQLDEWPQFGMNLGFMLVSGYSDLALNLPADSNILAHWRLVETALAAYRNQQIDVCEQVLQQLPFRSVFRDFRTLLKAQLASACLPEQAQLLLAKIPEQSPYRLAANALQLYLAEGHSFVQNSLGLDPHQLRFVALAKGFSNQQIGLLEALNKLSNQDTDKSKFNLVLQQRSTIGIEAAQAYCLGMLAVYPQGFKDYLKHFPARNVFEASRIQALYFEITKDFAEAESYWERCIGILDVDGASDNKKIALILRHMAIHALHHDSIEFLIDSLEYDREDRDTYFKIQDYFQQNQADSNLYLFWLERSLQNFPNDIDFLARAAKAAADKKAFKKAVGYAEQLLTIDPVNTLAKQLLFTSHLAHARRLLKTKKFHLVSKEIDSAQKFAMDKHLHQQAELLRGFYVCLAEDKAQGIQLIIETLKKLNDDPINMLLQAYLEAKLLGLPMTLIFRALPTCTGHFLTAQQLMRLITQIKHYDEQFTERRSLFSVLDKIKSPVKQSLEKQDFEQELLLNWCRVLVEIGHFDWLKHAAKLGLHKWTKPIWHYYSIFADCQGNAVKVDLMATFRLQNALEDARAKNDQKTVVLIGRFLDEARGQFDPFDLVGEIFDDFQDIEESYDIFDDLFAHVSKTDMRKIDLKIEEIMLRLRPEQLLNEIFGQQANKINPKQQLALLTNPGFISAIAALRAADELGIDIGVRFEEVVSRFQNRSPQIQIPFF